MTNEEVERLLAGWCATKLTICREGGGPVALVPQLVMAFTNGRKAADEEIALMPHHEAIAPYVRQMRVHHRQTERWVAVFSDAWVRQVPVSEMDLTERLSDARERGDMSVEDALVVHVLETKTGVVRQAMVRYRTDDDGLPIFDSPEHQRAIGGRVVDALLTLRGDTQ